MSLEQILTDLISDNPEAWRNGLAKAQVKAASMPQPQLPLIDSLQTLG